MRPRALASRDIPLRGWRTGHIAGLSGGYVQPPRWWLMIVAIRVRPSVGWIWGSYGLTSILTHCRIGS